MDIVERSYSTYVLLQLLGNYVTIALQGYELAKVIDIYNLNKRIKIVICISMLCLTFILLCIRLILDFLSLI